VGAIIIFLIGFWVANKASKLLFGVLKKQNVDITLSNFVTSLVKILIVVMVGIIALGKLGISVTPFVAAIGAASLGAGLAMQGMLSNYAAGITIIVTRPFAVTNTITVQGVTGIVKEINLGMTILTNEEGEEITIPNKHIVGEVIHNSFDYMLVETCIGISYQADPDRAIAVLSGTLQQVEEVATDPGAQIGIDAFGDSAVEIGVRYWVPTTRYYELKYQTNLQLFKALNEAGISIPFPQREVRLLNETPAGS
jgi:small conductance mechanosensitive channel